MGQGRRSGQSAAAIPEEATFSFDEDEDFLGRAVPLRQQLTAMYLLWVSLTVMVRGEVEGGGGPWS